MRRDRSLISWERRVEQHVGEKVGRGRGVIERAKEKCDDKVAWRLVCHGAFSGGNKASVK